VFKLTHASSCGLRLTPQAARKNEVTSNPRGRFLRITEEVSGRRNAIIIPMTGIDDFRDALNEIIKFSKILSPKT
jgi:hypothetical protein